MPNDTPQRTAPEPTERVEVDDIVYERNTWGWSCPNASGSSSLLNWPDAKLDRILALEQRVRELEAVKDGAYLERNQLVSLLARVFPSGTARTAIEGWSEDWHGCVYIDLPTGQASWHFHDSQAHLFDGLPPYDKPWDGHTTDEKYKRIADEILFRDEGSRP